MFFFQREAAAKRELYRLLDHNPHGDELSNLAARVADAENLSSNLDGRLDSTEDHVSSLQEHVNKLQQQADALTPVLRDSTAEAVAEVKAGVSALNAVVKGQCILVFLCTITDLP
jgi:chaperonin cofactor prefoldin